MLEAGWPAFRQMQRRGRNRSAHFIMNAHTHWRDKAQDAAWMAWARQLSEATAPFASDSVYINFMPDDESGRVERAYGTNYRRLADRTPLRPRQSVSP